MATAITLRLDPDAAAKVEELWHALAAAGLARDQIALGYPPHLTLAVSSGESAPDQLLPDAVRPHRAIPTAFAGLGLFPGLPACCWIAVAPSAALLSAQQAAAAALAPVMPHYRPDARVPHVTLAATLRDEDIAAAMRLLHGRFQPRTALLERIELVRFPPVEILASARLG